MSNFEGADFDPELIPRWPTCVATRTAFPTAHIVSPSLLRFVWLSSPSQL
eukprot:m.416386 g.416386  ORF g.416386 m.416386 type:complete len:50 (-) comp29958_c0_seq1:25-174(-)